MTYPTFESLQEAGLAKSGVLFTTQRSLRSLVPQFFIFGVLAFIAFLINRAGDTDSLKFVFEDVPVRVIGLIPFAYFLNIVRLYYNDIYIVEIEKISSQEGRLSFTLNQPSAIYIDIRAIVVHQSFWGRVLGYGDVFIGTAAQDERDITLRNVADPHDLSILIEKLGAYQRSKLTSGEKMVR